MTYSEWVNWFTDPQAQIDLLSSTSVLILGIGGDWSGLLKYIIVLLVRTRNTTVHYTMGFIHSFIFHTLNHQAAKTSIQVLKLRYYF